MTHWTAIVGIAGILGSVLTGYLTNKAAESRLLLQQDFEDRRRFHKERADLYGRVLGLAQICRVKIVEVRIAAKLAPNAGVPGEIWLPMTTAITDFSAAAKTVNFLGNPASRETASGLLDAVHQLFGRSRVAEDAEFDKLNQTLRNAETAFADAARAELMPAEMERAAS